MTIMTLLYPYLVIKILGKIENLLYPKICQLIDFDFVINRFSRKISIWLKPDKIGQNLREAINHNIGCGPLRMNRGLIK